MIRSSIAVVIPAKNEGSVIGETLEALRQEALRGFIDEIVVVDNHSEDQTAEIASEYSARVLSSEGGVGRVRNWGAANTTAEFIVFVDADVIVLPGWSEAIVSHIERCHVSVRDRLLFGAVYGIPADSNWLVRRWYSALDARTTHNYINSGNMVIARTLFEEIGGFDESLSSGEDVDLCERALEHNAVLDLVEEVATVHRGYPSSIPEFFRRERWHGQNMKKYLTRPLRSKALIFSFLNLFVLISLVISLFAGSLFWGFIVALSYIIFLVALSRARLKSGSLLEILQMSLLYGVYGVARAFALCESLFKTRGRSARARR